MGEKVLFHIRSRLLTDSGKLNLLVIGDKKGKKGKEEVEGCGMDKTPDIAIFNRDINRPPQKNGTNQREEGGEEEKTSPQNYPTPVFEEIG